MRVGEILLASGAGAADVTATMRAITEHYGLRGTDIDVTFVSLRMSHQVSDEVPVMLVVVRLVNSSKGWYEAGPAVVRRQAHP